MRELAVALMLNGVLTFLLGAMLTFVVEVNDAVRGLLSQGIILLALGAILWQLTELGKRK